MQQELTFCAPEEDADSRLDSAIAKHCPQLTRSAAQKLLGCGAVAVNQKSTVKNYRLRAGDFVRILLPEPVDDTAAPEEIPLDIVYEDNDLLVVNKPKGMVILNPADYTEAKKAVRAAAEHDGPVYLRFGRLAAEGIFDESEAFEIGRGVELTQGSDVTLIATGLMVGEALRAREQLKSEGISARVINMATIKPLDAELVRKAAAETGAIVTAEEHNIIGGLGSAVAEAVCESVPVPVVRVGVNDVFGKSGPAKELLVKFGLTAEHIAQSAKQAITLKK